MKTKTPKPKKAFMDVYKKYNPDVEGFGSPNQWRNAFNDRMGLNEAGKVLGSKDPYEILGVSKSATLDEVKKAYRKLALLHHPDRHGDPEKFKDVQAAWEILEDKLKNQSPP